MSTQHNRPRRLEATQPIQPEPPLDRDDRGNGQPVMLRDPDRAPAPPPLPFDLSSLMPLQLVRASVRAGRAIPQPALALRLKAGSPLPNGAARNAELPGELRFVHPGWLVRRASSRRRANVNRAFLWCSQVLWQLPVKGFDNSNL